MTLAVVRATARTALPQAHSRQRSGRSVSVGRLLDLLPLLASLRSSLSAVVRRFAFGFSHETARQAVAANLPDLNVLLGGLHDALFVLGRRMLRCRRFGFDPPAITQLLISHCLPPESDLEWP